MLRKRLAIFCVLLIIISLTCIVGVSAASVDTDNNPTTPLPLAIPYIEVQVFNSNVKATFALPAPTVDRQNTDVEIRYNGYLIAYVLYEYRAGNLLYTVMPTVQWGSVRIYTQTAYPIPGGDNGSLVEFSISSEDGIYFVARHNFAYHYRNQNDREFTDTWAVNYEDYSSFLPTDTPLDTYVFAIPCRLVNAGLSLGYDAFFSFENPVRVFTISIPTVSISDWLDYNDDIITQWSNQVETTQILEGTATPPATGWIVRMLDGFLGIEILPGFTIGGIVLAFLGISIAIACLKLWAGG